MCRTIRILATMCIIVLINAVAVCYISYTDMQQINADRKEYMAIIQDLQQNDAPIDKTGIQVMNSYRFTSSDSYTRENQKLYKYIEDYITAKAESQKSKKTLETFLIVSLFLVTFFGLIIAQKIVIRWGGGSENKQ